ncbi:MULTISPECIES: DUF5667 domain-containing protein [Nocardioides]|uniref:DUF5667 domain-containing protein n=1 Tax=Nocardioides vastitatis TaxID=2568655 RepID=A0ABW0ZKJ2_9ACTN|nr:DUF5667 domain-containing protein [Nocardioides sp.]THJ10606.1 hypothetical protein E7Z54_02635 [Nocardioides sp.]
MRGSPWSRRAEEFDALVSGYAGAEERRTELLAVVAALRSTPPVEARPDFVATLRTQLVAAAERDPAGVDQGLAAHLTPRQRRGSRERRLAAVVGGFAVVSATGSMAMASQGALPGDVLYPVKRAIENAQTNFQPDNAAKSESLIAHAEARLEEVQQLTAAGADPDVIATTLEDFTEQTNQAADFALDDYTATAEPTPIVDLRAFAAESMDVLAALGPVVPDSVRPVLITATQTVRQVDAAAWEACPTCAGGDIAELPEFAAQPLRLVLSGEIPDAASVTNQGTKPRKSPRDGQRGQTPLEEPTGDPVTPPAVPSEVPPPIEPTKEGSEDDGDIADDLGIDGKPGLGPRPPADKTPERDADDDGALSGILVDGVTGVLGGLS